jgi:lipoprotein-releasing system permease protein
MFIILTMIILVAAFNIVAMLIMIVIEKGRDISILKSMGVGTKSIMMIFKIAGMFIGIVGTSCGLLLGYTLCFLLKNYIRYPLNPEVYLTDTLPVQVDPINFVLIALSSLVICYIATLYPSYRAAKLDPVEGLRYE